MSRKNFLDATVVGVFSTKVASHFATLPVETLIVDLQGIPGDRHYGFTRPAGPREPWFKRGTQIRSGRQITIVSAEELAEIARRMELPHIDPRAIGANILVAGVPNFTQLPWGSRLFFGEGAVLVNEGVNAPCRYAGAAVAKSFPDRTGLDTLFVQAAKNLRGIVASVERAGEILPGPVRIKILAAQKQWNGGTLL